MSENNCLFCKITQHKTESALLYEDDAIVAFRDIHPQAPVHMLVVPREHVESVSACESKHAQLLGQLILVAKRLADQESLTKNGYRLVINTGSYGGQTVGHLHIHVLGGRSFGWPPG